MKHIYCVALYLPLIMATSSACSTTETTATPVTIASTTTLRGVVDRPLVSPLGDVDGLLLRDGAIVRLPPGALASNDVVSGDTVDVQGALSTKTPVPIVERASVSRGGTVLTASVSLPPPRRRGPAADAALLQPLTATGTVHALLFNREGLEDGLVLDDGTTARVPPRAGLERLNLKVGNQVTITGRGSVNGPATGLRAETIAVGNGAAVVVDTPPPVPAALSRDGTVQRVFVNPHGDIDLILLSDGSAVRIPPTPSSVAGKLASGQTVHFEGETVGADPVLADQHATEVRLPNGEVVASEPASPPQPPPPAALPRVDDTSTIARLFRGPRGDVSAIVLADGAMVRLSKRLAEEAGTAMTVGARVHVEGEGGRYALGTAIHADTLRLDSGQTFVDPGPPGLRPPPPAAP